MCVSVCVCMGMCALVFGADHFWRMDSGKGCLSGSVWRGRGWATGIKCPVYRGWYVFVQHQIFISSKALWPNVSGSLSPIADAFQFGFYHTLRPPTLHSLRFPALLFPPWWLPSFSWQGIKEAELKPTTLFFTSTFQCLSVFSLLPPKRYSALIAACRGYSLIIIIIIIILCAPYTVFTFTFWKYFL